MPRKATSRFSKLREVLRKGGTPAAGTPAANFLDFQLGKNDYKISRPIPPGSRARGAYAIYPFNVPLVEAEIYAAPVTAFSKTINKAVGGLETAANHQTFSDAVIQTDDFNPAIVRYSRTNTGTATKEYQANTISQITKQSYNRLKTFTATIPFGAKTATDETSATLEEETVKKAVMDVLTPAKGIVSMTYYPEEWVMGQKKLSKAADLPDVALPTI